MAGNFYTMTPYSTWAMPKIDWDLIYKAGNIQQARGDKAEAKYSEFTELYDNLKLHEKYNESYQNWRTETDKELDNLINNHGGKLGTVGFNRDLDRLIGSKKNDPWIKNAIQSSEQAKLYEENILRNPDIKPYNDPNSEEYLDWLEDKSPSFKYKGFYKDAPVEKWFEAKAKEIPASKWTEFKDYGEFGTQTIQHDAKKVENVKARLDEMKAQFAKTSEGEQLKRMIEAGEFGNLTYDEVFASYVNATAEAVKYDNSSSTVAADINKNAQFEREKHAADKANKEEQLRLQKQQINQQGQYQKGMLEVAKMNAETEQAQVAAQISSGYYNRASGSGAVTNSGAVDEFIFPLVNSIENNPDEFNTWKTGKVGGEFKSRIATMTGGATKAKGIIENNITQGNTQVETPSGKAISVAKLNSYLNVLGADYKIKASEDLILRKTDTGADVYISASTSALTENEMKGVIKEYNKGLGEGQAALTKNDFEKTASGDYILRLRGKDPTVTNEFKDFSNTPQIRMNGKNIDNPLYVPSVPAQQNTPPPPISNTNYGNSQTTTTPQQTNQAVADTTTSTTLSPDTSRKVANAGIDKTQVVENNGQLSKEYLEKEREKRFVYESDKGLGFSLSTKYVDEGLYLYAAQNEEGEPYFSVISAENEDILGEMYDFGLSLRGKGDKSTLEIHSTGLSGDEELANLRDKFKVLSSNVAVFIAENNSETNKKIILPDNRAVAIVPGARHLIVIDGKKIMAPRFPKLGKDVDPNTGKPITWTRESIKPFAELIAELAKEYNKTN